VARGGFEIDIKWSNSKLEKVVIRSRNGGVCRLRSLTELAGLTLAKSENPNALYHVPPTPKPIINPEVALKPVELKKTYLYDLNTEKGKEYTILSK
jgi:alpha-L-fucosidase 2